MGSQKPLVVIDTSVIMHHVFKFYDKSKPKKAYFPYTNQQRDKRIQDTVSIYNTLFFLGDVNPDDFEIIWVGDSEQENPYWRRKYWWDWWDSHSSEEQDKLVKPGTQKRKGYKGNRTSTPDQQWCKKRFNKLSGALVYDGYEADDIASAICQVIDRKIILVTTDNDWLQLVNNNVFWICAEGYSPQFRDHEKGMIWFRNKLINGTKKEVVLGEKLDLDLKDGIVDWKVMMGDTSDNLCAKSPREVIDLVNTPQEHKIWLKRDFKDNFIWHQQVSNKKNYLELASDALDNNLNILTPTIKENIYEFITY